MRSSSAPASCRRPPCTSARAYSQVANPCVGSSVGSAATGASAAHACRQSPNASANAPTHMASSAMAHGWPVVASSRIRGTYGTMRSASTSPYASAPSCTSAATSPSRSSRARKPAAARSPSANAWPGSATVAATIRARIASGSSRSPGSSSTSHRPARVGSSWLAGRTNWSRTTASASSRAPAAVNNRIARSRCPCVRACAPPRPRMSAITLGEASARSAVAITSCSSQAPAASRRARGTSAKTLASCTSRPASAEAIASSDRPTAARSRMHACSTAPIRPITSSRTYSVTSTPRDRASSSASAGQPSAARRSLGSTRRRRANSLSSSGVKRRSVSRNTCACPLTASRAMPISGSRRDPTRRWALAGSRRTSSRRSREPSESSAISWRSSSTRQTGDGARDQSSSTRRSTRSASSREVVGLDAERTEQTRRQAHAARVGGLDAQRGIDAVHRTAADAGLLQQRGLAEAGPGHERGDAPRPASLHDVEEARPDQQGFRCGLRGRVRPMYRFLHRRRAYGRVVAIAPGSLGAPCGADGWASGRWGILATHDEHRSRGSANDCVVALPMVVVHRGRAAHGVGPRRGRVADRAAARSQRTDTGTALAA